MSQFEPMLPFDLVEATEHHGPYITTAFGTTVCDFYTMSKPMEWSTASGGTSKPIPFADASENAAFIVKAVNSRAALVDALQQIINMNVQYAIDRYGDAAQAETMACVSVARAALSQAEGA